MAAKPRIFWVDADRFDRKGDKSTWLEMAQALQAQGFETHIVTGYGRQKYLPRDSSVTIDYVEAIDLPFIFRWTLLLSILIFLVRRLLREDIIMLHPEGLWIARLLRFAGARNVHLDIRTVPVEINSLKRRLDRFLFWTIPMRFLRGPVRGYSAITDRLKQAVEAEFRVSLADCAIWASGVNTHLFRPIGRSPDELSERPFVLFYHGTISRQRGFENLVRAMRLIDQRNARKVRLLLVGAGADLPALSRLVTELGLEGVVTFKGSVPYDRVASEVVQADCCICPLPNRPEWNMSSPLKILEYMACGKPIIVTPIDAHREVLEGADFAVWTKGDDPADFRDAIEYALQHESQLRRAAEHAPTLARQKHEWTIRAQVLGEYLMRRFGAEGPDRIKRK